MENQNKKGRPAKSKDKVKLKSFSVWATEAQRAQINELVKKSEMSASKFFLTLALDTPLKLPQRKTLPASIAELIRMLKQHAGMLALVATKTKDQHMQSENWRVSSQSVKYMADLIMLWIYEDFQIRSVHKTLSDIHDWMKELYSYQSAALPESESKGQLLEKTSVLYHASAQLLEKYQKHYQTEQTPDLIPAFAQAEGGGDIHDLIERTLDQIVNRRRR
ncbi:MAG TPA: hypothetical protein VGN64_21675 [Dyadobacter sp.]|jgi:hypothetical protein|nr:hypothetical protein [Dyadobacter sp.]